MYAYIYIYIDMYIPILNILAHVDTRAVRVPGLGLGALRKNQS